MVDLKAKPFFLSNEQIKWVKDTLSSLSLEEKLGQLFVDHSHGSLDEEYIKDRTHKTMCGGLRYINLKPAEMRQHNLTYQKYSKVPLLVASNIEAGGNGACLQGTVIGEEAKVCATNDPKYGYYLGYVGGMEAKAIGCNWAFTPIVDICYNWRNPIVSTRTWGDNADKVLEFSSMCLKGIHDAGIAATAKHFPGDGVDERDHHFSSAVNNLSCEEWDKSFGRVYKKMIDEGVEAVMAGHIMLPAYEKKFNPDITTDEYLPASQSKLLLTDLLRKQLGFNGLIITDASHMVGFSGRMCRRKALVTAINAGCDMILFFNDVEEDLAYMNDAYEKGELSEERLDEAVTRILALKAKVGLWKGIPKEEDLPSLSVVGCEDHRKLASEVTDKSITLAKMKGAKFLPVTPEKNKRVLVVPINTPQSEFSKFVSRSTGKTNDSSAIADKIIAALNSRGFEAEKFVSPLLVKNDPNISPYEYKSSIEKFKAKYDLVIDVAYCKSFSVVQRLSWDTPKGGFEVPWYWEDVPIIFASFASPFHLADVPQVKCMINCYDAENETVQKFVEKITGESEFKGVNPVDVYCNMLDTRL